MSERLLGGGETILVVEDDASVRKVIVAMLGRLGYRVFQAEDGGVALDLLRHSTDSFHLLLTDITLPGIGGPELADQVRKQWPGIKVIFATGHTDHATLQDGLARHAAIAIQKPFTKETLARAIREALDR